MSKEVKISKESRDTIINLLHWIMGKVEIELSLDYYENEKVYDDAQTTFEEITADDIIDQIPPPIPSNVENERSTHAKSD